MGLHPAIEPFNHGLLEVGDGNRIYWETCGNPDGKPALVLHGGPGSGAGEWARRLFDPAAYRAVVFDQRNCGRSLPSASLPDTDLSTNTTWHLLADIERLRQHLEIERWLVIGGSWGSTLALTYAEAHRERVSDLIVFGVGLGRKEELDWLFRGGLSKLFPAEWARLATYLASSDPTRELHRRLNDPDPAIRQEAATEWCMWESATPKWPPTKGLLKQFQDPVYALTFARIVNHYVLNDLWMDDGLLLREAYKLRGLPGSIINGRFDFQSPLTNAWELHQAWPESELIVIEDAGHSISEAFAAELVRATGRFA